MFSFTLWTNYRYLVPALLIVQLNIQMTIEGMHVDSVSENLQSRGTAQEMVERKDGSRSVDGFALVTGAYLGRPPSQQAQPRMNTGNDANEVDGFHVVGRKPATLSPSRIPKPRHDNDPAKRRLLADPADAAIVAWKRHGKGPEENNLESVLKTTPPATSNILDRVYMLNKDQEPIVPIKPYINQARNAEKELTSLRNEVEKLMKELEMADNRAIQAERVATELQQRHATASSKLVNKAAAVRDGDGKDDHTRAIENLTAANESLRAELNDARSHIFSLQPYRKDITPEEMGRVSQKALVH